MLLGLAGAALLAPVLGVLGGCGQNEPDPLQLLSDRALTDAARIDRVRGLAGLSPTIRDRLTELAEARRQHAHALTTLRSTGDANAPATPAPTNPPPADQNPTSALAGVREALGDAQQQAANLALTLARQPAALVGSITACCAAYQAILQ